MVANIHYRWDFIGLSTDTKPTPETSEKVVDGSTYYTSDDSKLYIWYKDQWYEKEVTGGGGGGSYTAGDGIVIDNDEISVDLVQSTGTSTTSVMSQKAVTDALAGGDGGVTELTTADYNWPADNPDGIAIWLLDEGEYRLSVSSLKFYLTTSTRKTWLRFTVLNVLIKGTDALHHSNDGYWYKVYMTTNGSTFVEERFITTDGLANTTGNSTTSVMSQNATSSMIFPDPTENNRVAIAGTVISSASMGVAVGKNSYVSGSSGVALGAGVNSATTATVFARGGVAIGAGATANTVGEFNIGSQSTTYGYNGTNYRLLTGVHDGQTAHDAVTVEQVNATIDAINTALSTSIPHIGLAS